MFLKTEKFIFSPELILVSAGYDAAVGCPEGIIGTLKEK